MQRKRIEGLKSPLKNDLEQRVVEHRNRFIKMFMGRYRELLPYLIQYHNIDTTSIDPLKLEHALRNDINVVVGKAKNDKIMIMGYVEDNRSYENPVNFLTTHNILKEDINFIVPKYLIPTTFTEISNYDNCKTGDFIVLRNKALNFISDLMILQHYTIELGEIVLSRFSLSMQSKINTFFIGQNNDETINQLVTKLYNGSPFVSVNKFFDPKENIYTLENGGIASMFNELKREYQNKISELNNMLGINSLAVEKESGISDTEAKSNTGYTTSNANIYIETRQNEIDKLNKRFGLNISVQYNDEVKSELNELSKLGEYQGDDNNG